jgi:peptidoglycan hydrolase-like protein with peptidoglycan-binding domain
MVDLRRAGLALGLAAVALAILGAAGAQATESPSRPTLPPLSERVKTHEALRLLAKLGYDAGAVDSTMAINIAGAIRDFQRAHNLAVDGKVTDELMTALRDAGS